MKQNESEIAEVDATISIIEKLVRDEVKVIDIIQSLVAAASAQAKEQEDGRN